MTDNIKLNLIVEENRKLRKSNDLKADIIESLQTKNKELKNDIAFLKMKLEEVKTGHG